MNLSRNPIFLICKYYSFFSSAAFLLLALANDAWHLAVPSRRQRHSTHTHTHTHFALFEGFSQDKERKQTNRQIKILKSVGQSQTGVIVVGDPWKFSLDCLSNALSGATSFVQGNSWAISSSHTHINHHRKTDEIFVKIGGRGNLISHVTCPQNLSNIWLKSFSTSQVMDDGRHVGGLE